MKRNICLFSIILFTNVGCGGGSDNNDASSETSNTPSTTTEQTSNSPQVVTPLTSEHTIPVGSITVKQETGHEGLVRHVIAQSGYITEEYTLIQGISSLGVSEIQKNTEAEIDCRGNSQISENNPLSDFRYSEKVSYDQQNSLVVRELVTSTNHYNCSYNWDSLIWQLPANFTNSRSIGGYLDEWGKSNVFIVDGSSTCPEEVLQFTRLRPSYCKGFYVENIQITDDSGNIHKITYKESSN